MAMVTNGEQLLKEVEEERRTLAKAVMGNPLLLERIAKCAPADTLLSIRRTCQLWNHMFIPEVRRGHSPITLTSHRNPEGDSDSSLKSFVDCIQRNFSLQHGPFSRFSVSCGRISGAPTDGAAWEAAFETLMTTMGASMTELRLEWRGKDLLVERLRRLIFDQTPQLEVLTLCGPNKRNLEEEVAPLLLRALPNLRKLEVTSIGLDVAYARLIADVVKCAQRLQALHLDEEITDETIILPILDGLRVSDHIANLRSLALGCQSAPLMEALFGLGRQGLRLETLWLSIRISGSDTEMRETSRALYGFLLTQAPSLRQMELSLSSEMEEGGATLRIPRLGRLHKLELTRDDFSPLTMEFDGRTFEHCFPLLTGFTLHYRTDERSENFEADLRAMPHPGVTTLTVSGIISAQLVRFAAPFPSVSRLELLDVQQHEMEEEDVASTLQQWAGSVDVTWAPRLDDREIILFPDLINN